MILKIIFLFLVFMAVMGMFGKLRAGGRKRRCRKCGGHVIGGSCPCGVTR
ncbi:hypothetical protein [Pontivivens ytuae]|uniref:Uncharacterized protein n=1 Tax=Pontivivens ytuae TaxID=2789856 RepID=A0A7S9LNM9_9RHOB|nr:hypothetical protein [Pontivivens ytuae]QPH52441.1 hypothetical protein I0K15_11450 [Pontivivens ytuae]